MSRSLAWFSRDAEVEAEAEVVDELIDSGSPPVVFNAAGFEFTDCKYDIGSSRTVCEFVGDGRF